MTGAINPAATSPGLLETAREAASSGVTWLKTHSASVANRVSEVAKTVANVVIKFFTETCPKYLHAAKGAVVALPTSVKYAMGGGALVVGTYALYNYFFSGKVAPEQPAAEEGSEV
jgi:hypothetical protein